MYVCTHRERSYSQYLTDGVNHQNRFPAERERGRKEGKLEGSERHYILGGERNISGSEGSQSVTARRFDSIL